MIRIALIGATIFILQSLGIAWSQSAPELLPRCRIDASNLCGYIDGDAWRDEGRKVIAIRPKFDDTDAFSDGLAAVTLDGKVGYINAAGDFVIRPQFELAGAFKLGRAAAGSRDGLGLIDGSGKWLVRPMFSQVKILTRDVVLAAPVSPSQPAYTSIYERSLSGAGLYHIQKGWLTNPEYVLQPYSDGDTELVWALEPRGTLGTWDDLYGLMSADGTWVIEPSFTWVGKLISGLAPVQGWIDGELRSGALNASGEIVIPFDFNFLSHLEEGFLREAMPGSDGAKIGIVNRRGELLAGRYFDEIDRPDRFERYDHEPFDFFSVRDGSTWKTLTRDGQLLPDQRVGTVLLACEEFDIVFEQDGYGLIPKNGSNPRIKFDRPLFPYSNRKCAPPPTLIRDGTYAKLLRTGAIFGGFYENSRGFFGPHLWVRIEGEWRLVDQFGNAATSERFDSIDVEDGSSRTRDVPQEIDPTTYIGKVGDLTYRLRYDSGDYIVEPYSIRPKDRQAVLDCGDGLSRKSENGLWGMVDETGDYVIAPTFRAISCFGGVSLFNRNPNLAWVPDAVNQKWCPIDRNGYPRDEPDCKLEHYSVYWSHHNPELFVDDPYENSVLWERAMLDFGEGRRESKPGFVPW